MTYNPSNPNGQTNMAGSQPVTIASDQSTLNVANTAATPAGNNNIGDVDVATIAAGDNNIGNVDIVSLPSLPAGDNNIGDVDVATIAAGDNNIGNVDVLTLPSIPAGNNNIGDVDVASLPSLPAGANLIGQVTANAGTDLNTSALNLEATQSAMSAKLPASLGPKTGANSFSVVPATDAVFRPDTVATGTITTQNLVPAGSATAGSAVLSGTLNGPGTVTIQVTGTYTGALSFQGTVDNTTWVTVSIGTFINVNSGAVTTTITSGAQGIYQADCGGYQQVRITGLAAMTGTATVTLRASSCSGYVAIDAPIPAGTNVIGAVSTVTTVTTVGTVTNITNQGQIVDNAAFTDGTTRLNMSGYIFDEVAGTALTENDGAAARIDSKRAQVGVIEDATTRGQRMAVSAAGAAATNLAQIAGTTTSVNSGNKDAGTQRIVIATDQPTIPSQEIPQSASTNALSSADSTALAASLVIKAGAGRLFLLTGLNTGPAQYIQVFNATSAPANGTAPILLAYVPSFANFSFDLSTFGRYFSTGITVTNSTTAATKTLGASDCWFNAGYL